MKIGAKRSPIRTPRQAAALAREIDARPRRAARRPDGLRGPHRRTSATGRPASGLQGRVIQWMQTRSAREIAERRAAVVAAVSEIAELEFVNGGGTGSLHRTTARRPPSPSSPPARASTRPRCSTPTARSACARPRCSRCRSCASRRPRIATVLGGGYLASGPASRAGSRPPPPRRPAARPLRGRGRGADAAARRRRRAIAQVGDRVYFRHAKAGELCERFDTLHLVSGDGIVDEVPTYRGEGRTFL